MICASLHSYNRYYDNCRNNKKTIKLKKLYLNADKNISILY